MNSPKIVASGHYFEFERGEWVKLEDGRSEKFVGGGVTYVGTLTKEEREELDRIIKAFLDGRTATT